MRTKKTGKPNKDNFQPDGADAGPAEPHVHDFRPTDDRDAGRVVEKCFCGARRVQGEPGKSV